MAKNIRHHSNDRPLHSPFSWKFAARIFAAGVSIVMWAPYASRAGSISSGGGQTWSNEINPWFAGHRTITYCVETTKGVSVSQAVAEGQVRRAVEDWMVTIRDINRMPKPGAVPGRDSLAFLAQEAQLVACGSRHNKDLRVILGLAPKGLRAQLGLSIASLVAYAWREFYNPASGWSKGTVWLAPDLGSEAVRDVKAGYWSKPNTIYHVALHELGHVFGFPHDAESDSFMEGFFPRRVIAQAGACSSVACGQSDRRTSRYFLRTGLVASEEPVCASIGRIPKGTAAHAFLRKGLDVGDAQQGHACLRVRRTKSDDNHARAEIFLERAHQGGAKLSFELGFTALDGGMQLQGLYPCVKAATPVCAFRWLTFARFGQTISTFHAQPTGSNASYARLNAGLRSAQLDLLVDGVPETFEWPIRDTAATP